MVVRERFQMWLRVNLRRNLWNTIVNFNRNNKLYVIAHGSRDDNIIIIIINGNFSSRSVREKSEKILYQRYSSRTVTAVSGICSEP